MTSTVDDEEDLQNYLAEVGTHDFGEEDTGGEKSAKKSKQKSKAKAETATNGKGKGRAAPPVAVSDPEPTNPDPDEVVEEDLMERGYAPGPVPRLIVEKLHVLEGEYDVKVAALASLCNKDPATLCRAITPHKLLNMSAWNMYLAYHALHHLKRPDGECVSISVHRLESSNKFAVSVTQYNIDTRTVFEALLPGLSKAEIGKTPLVLEHLPWLQSWWKKLNANHIENLHAKGQYKAQAKEAVEPLIQMVCFCNSIYCFETFQPKNCSRQNNCPTLGGYISSLLPSTPAADSPSRLGGHARWNEFATGMIRVSSAL
jgi:hypothetical protein